MTVGLPEYVLNAEEVRRLEMVEWVYTAADGTVGKLVELGPCFKDRMTKAAAYMQLDEFEDLTRRGWLQNLTGPVNPERARWALAFRACTCEVTLAGAHYVETIMLARSDRSRRRVAARDAFLHDVADRGGTMRWSNFYGVPFNSHDAHIALEWLTRHGYVSSGKLTSEGEDVIESGESVNAYHQRTSGAITTTVIGDNNNVIAGSPNATQSIVIGSVERDKIIALVRTFEQAMPALDLAEPAAHTVRTSLNELQVIADQPTVPRNRVRKALEALALAAGTSAATGLAELLVKELGHLIGKF
jgi:hypothetical protein